MLVQFTQFYEFLLELDFNFISIKLNVTNNVAYAENNTTFYIKFSFE